MKILKFFCILSLMVLFLGKISFANDDSLCVDIAKKGVQIFKTNQKKGLKILTKAQKMCPKNEAINFNLALSYFNYGNLNEAAFYSRKALEINPENVNTLNLLAFSYLKSNSHLEDALKYAIKANKKKPNNPSIIDTLIYAHLKNGNYYKALILAHKSKKKFLSDEKIEQKYNQAVAEYISFYLNKAKNGKTKEAILGLGKIDFDENIISTYCYMLQKNGNIKKALEISYKNKKQYPRFAKVFNQLIDNFIQDQYKIFKAGNRKQAYKRIETAEKLYPVNDLKLAKNSMLDAVLNDESSIVIPEAKKYDNDFGKSATSLTAGLFIEKKSTVDLVSDVDKNIPKSSVKKENAVAVVIGNKNYQNGIPNVKYALKDANYVKKYLTSLLGFDEKNIIFIKDAKLTDFYTVFGDEKSFKGKLFNYIKKGSDAEVFVYYSGHGAPSIKDKDAFIVPVDANVDYIERTGFKLDTFYSNLKKIPAKKITIVLDSCFSGNSQEGMLVKNVSPALLESATPIQKFENSIVFSSTSQGELSHWYEEEGHSLFTYFFLKGMQGDADKNKNNEITVGELKNYLQDNVAYLARRMQGGEQNPIVEGDDNFVFCKF